jgi:hypothetical protein
MATRIVGIVYRERNRGILHEANNWQPTTRWSGPSHNPPQPPKAQSRETKAESPGREGEVAGKDIVSVQESCRLSYSTQHASCSAFLVYLKIRSTSRLTQLKPQHPHGLFCYLPRAERQPDHFLASMVFAVVVGNSTLECRDSPIRLCGARVRGPSGDNSPPNG